MGDESMNGILGPIQFLGRARRIEALRAIKCSGLDQGVPFTQMPITTFARHAAFRMVHRPFAERALQLKRPRTLTRYCSTASLVLIMAGAAQDIAIGQPTNASQGNPVRAGEWEISPQSSAGASISYRLCFKTGGNEDLQLLLPRLPPDAGCPGAQTVLKDGVFELRLACPGRSVEMTARYQLGPELINGTVTLTQGTPPQTSQQQIVARRVGACPG